MRGTRLAQRLRWFLSYRTLLKYLVLKEIKVKSRGTYLGVGWTLMNPLFTIVVYFVVFRHVFRVAIPAFLGFFLLGFLMWNFFSRSITSASTSITENDTLVKRAVFPMEVLPLTKVLYHLVNHLIALGIALPLLFALGEARLTWHLLWLAPVLAAFTVFALAIGFLLSTSGVFLRDTRDILDVTLPGLFWATPIFYAPEMVPRALQPALWVNPLTAFIGAVRAAVLHGHAPAAGDVALIALWTVTGLAAGLLVFMRNQPRFAEET